MENIDKTIRINISFTELKTGCSNCFNKDISEVYYFSEIEKIEKLIDKFNDLIENISLGCSIYFSIDISSSYNNFVGYLYNNLYSLSGYNKYIFEEIKHYYEGQYNNKEVLLITQFDKKEIISIIEDYSNNNSLFL